MESHIRVQTETWGPDAFWSFFEDKPEVLADGAASWGLMGIILGMATNVGGGLILFMPQFLNGTVGILWYNWVILALSVPLLVLQIWGLG